MEKLISACSTPKKHRPSHPNTQTMVDEAFKVLNKCSYRAIKDFIARNYFVDLRYILNRIKSYIRESVANGKFIQMTGHGMNGSFRLSAAAKRNPKKFIIRKRKILKRKDTDGRIAKKPITFLIEPHRRRTSITFSGARRNSTGCHMGSPRSSGPRLAKVKLERKDKVDENNNLPSTSSDAIQAPTQYQNKLCKLSHMC